MAFIPTRGFLGTIKDIVLRGFNISDALPMYAMAISGIEFGPLIDSKPKASILMTATLEAGTYMQSKPGVEPCQ